MLNQFGIDFKYKFKIRGMNFVLGILTKCKFVAAGIEHLRPR